MIDTLLVTEDLIGNNVEIPTAIYEKHLKAGLTTKNLIRHLRNTPKKSMAGTYATALRIFTVLSKEKML